MFITEDLKRDLVNELDDVCLYLNEDLVWNEKENKWTTEENMAVGITDPGVCTLLDIEPELIYHDEDILYSYNADTMISVFDVYENFPSLADHKHSKNEFVSAFRELAMDGLIEYANHYFDYEYAA